MPSNVVELRPMLSAAQAAERIGCSTKTVRRYVRAGELRAAQYGSRGRLRISERDLAAFLERFKRAPGA